MRAIIAIILLNIVLLGFPGDIESFSADFEQRITDDQNKTLVYHGHVWSKKPDKAVWHYRSPVEKKVHINGKHVLIIEPDLEQALMRRLDKEIDLMAIVKDAKMTSPGQYEAQYETQRFYITLKDGVLEAISYRDMFDNVVKINFSKQIQNDKLDTALFEATVPAGYDIVR